MIAVCGVVLIVAIALVFPAGTYRHHRGTTTMVILEQNRGDEIRSSPGWEKCLIAVQKKRDASIPLAPSAPVQHVERVGSGQGKQRLFNDHGHCAERPH